MKNYSKVWNWAWQLHACSYSYLAPALLSLMIWIKCHVFRSLLFDILWMPNWSYRDHVYYSHDPKHINVIAIYTLPTSPPSLSLLLSPSLPLPFSPSLSSLFLLSHFLQVPFEEGEVPPHPTAWKLNPGINLPFYIYLLIISIHLRDTCSMLHTCRFRIFASCRTINRRGNQNRCL